MPRGAPDDSDVQKLGIVCRLDDMGELAARLGSPMLYHRFGDVVFMETFETGIARWQESWLYGDQELGLDTEVALSGGLSYKFDAYASDDCWGKILHYNAPISTPKIGLGFAFYPAYSDAKIRFGLDVYDGEYQHTFYLQYRTQTGKLEYWNGGTDWIEFADHGLMYLYFGTFHQVKLIIDYESRKYDKLYVDQSLYDLSSYLPVRVKSNELPRIHIDIGFALDKGNFLELFLDDIILTQNEV